MNRSSVIDTILVIVGIYLILQFIVGIRELWPVFASGGAGMIVFFAVMPGLFGLFGAVCLFGVYYRRKNKALKSKIAQE